MWGSDPVVYRADGIVPAVQAPTTIRGAGRVAHTLMPYLVDVAHLHRAARAGMRRESAPGIDGVSWARYRCGLRTRLEDLANRLWEGTWRPAPLRMVSIAAYTGKQFEAGIPTVEDRIVHRAIRSAVDPVLEHRLYAPWVSGYRPGRNRLTAVRHAAEHLNHHPWVVDVDVEAASAGGTTEQFVDWLAGCVSDGTFLHQVRTAVAGFPSPLTPGTGLWPMLFNLRMSQVDRHLDAVPVVRFADNYLAFAADGGQATARFEQIRVALGRVGLRPHDRKSRLRRPGTVNPEDLFLIGG